MITWEEHVKHAYSENSMQTRFTKTNIRCPLCGEAIYRDDSVVLTTYPPKYRFDCPKCGWHDIAPK